MSTLGVVDFNGCRCEALVATFGEGAPGVCGRCKLALRHAELELAGFLAVPKTWRRALGDCGVEIRGTPDGVSWAPCWAIHIGNAFAGTIAIRPILRRAAVDAEFAAAVATILSTQESRDEGCTKVGLYAVSHGVELEPWWEPS